MMVKILRTREDYLECYGRMESDSEAFLPVHLRRGNEEWSKHMKLFVKKPVEVQAMQVPQPGFENAEEAKALTDWLTANGCEFTTPKGGICIITREGDMLADFGDWIIREPFPTEDRRFYPCKSELFELTYDPVKDSEDSSCS